MHQAWRFTVVSLSKRGMHMVHKAGVLWNLAFFPSCPGMITQHIKVVENYGLLYAFTKGRGEGNAERSSLCCSRRQGQAHQLRSYAVWPECIALWVHAFVALHMIYKACQRRAWARCAALDWRKSAQRVHANLHSVLLTIFIAMNII